MTSTTHSPVLPTEIVGQAMDILDQSGLPAELRLAATHFVQLFLPPASESGIAAGVRLWNQAPMGLSEPSREFVLWARARFAGAPNLKRGDWIGSRYVAFHAWQRLLPFSERYPDHTPAEFVFRHFADCINASRTSENPVPSLYYRDTIAVRDVHLTGIHHLGLASSDSASYENWSRAFTDCVASVAELAPQLEIDRENSRPPRFVEKCTQIADLLVGDRRLGAARKPGAVGPRGPAGTSTTRHRHPGHVPPDRTDAAPLFRTDIDREESDTTSMVIVSVPPAASSPLPPSGSTADPDATGTRDWLRPNTREHCSPFQAHSARQLYRYQNNSIEARSVIGLSDPFRLPNPSVAACLSRLLDENPLLFVAGCISTVTGLSGPRVLGLERAVDSATPGDDRVLFLPTKGCLRYRMIDRVTSEGIPSFSPDFVDLPLPAFLVEVLATSRAAAPLKNLGAEFEKISRRLAAGFPGPRPTLERLAATFWSLVAPHGIDAIDAAWISGRKPRWLIAQPDYYRIELHQLAAAHQKAVATFASAIRRSEHASPALKALLARIVYADPPQRAIGSRFGHLLDNYSFGFQALRNAWHDLASRAPDTPSRESVPLLLDLLRLENVQLYVLQNLAAGLRPVGDVGRLYIGHQDGFFWKSDKASALFRERTAVPVPSILATYLQQWRRNLHRARKHLTDYGYRFEMPATGIAMAMDFQIDPGPRRINGVVLTDLRAREILHEYGLTRHFRLPKTNTHRHVMATALHRRAAESHRDAYMTHNRDGLSPFGPNSTLCVSSFHSFRQVMDEILTDVAPELLDLTPVLKHVV